MMKFVVGALETPFGKLPIGFLDDQGSAKGRISVSKKDVDIPSVSEVDGVSLYCVEIGAPFEGDVLRCILSEIESDHCDIESGECFESIRFICGKSVLSVATQDGTVINGIVPRRFKKKELDGYAWVNINQGQAVLDIEIPMLIENENLRVWFSMAWKNDADEDDISTWLAADELIFNLF